MRTMRKKRKTRRRKTMRRRKRTKRRTYGGVCVSFHRRFCSLSKFYWMAFIYLKKR
jgi:hypothetical protein